MHKKNLKLMLNITLMLMLLGVGSVITKAQKNGANSPYLPPLQANGGLFMEQCQWGFYAQIRTGNSETWADIDYNALMSIPIELGIWEGYDSDKPFGRQQKPYGAFWHIRLITPCGIKLSQVVENVDGTYRIDVFRTLILLDHYRQPCVLGDGSLHCGYHDFVFGHLAPDWFQVIGIQ